MPLLGARSTAAESDRRLREALMGLVSRLAVPAVRQVVARLIFELHRLAVPAYAQLENALLRQTDPIVLDAADLYHVIGDWEAEVLAVRRRRVEDPRGRGGQSPGPDAVGPPAPLPERCPTGHGTPG